MESSIEYPSAPRTPSSLPAGEASEVNDDNRGQSMADGSSEEHKEVQDTTVLPNFLRDHLRAPAKFTVTNAMKKYVEAIKAASTSEKKMYEPAAALLTTISKALFNTFKDVSSAKNRKLHRERHHIRPNMQGHLTFIDHHTSAPSHFPHGDFCEVKDQPDLLAVYDVGLFKQDAKGVYHGVPHHRIEGLVEAKSEKNGGGRKQAATYAYRHHQARPDRPGMYLLVLKPQWYQVLYSDPTGVIASPQIDWDTNNLDALVAYVYSHYLPPDKHILWDDTIRWSEPEDEPCRFPSWDIDVGEEKYTNGKLVFGGEPWGRQTNVFEAMSATGEQVIIKDCYRHHGRRFKEEDILEHIHKDGDLLGVVRLKDHKTILDADGRELIFDLKGQQAARSRERFVLLDTGHSLLKAESLRDLLMAVYDALELHRTKVVQRNVLHRDMSLYNILMYPTWGSKDGRDVMENMPPTIKDVLDGIRPVEERFPSCLVIDYDNAARLDCGSLKPEELTRRTGTPMYIARGVCVGAVSKRLDDAMWPPMPELSDEARELYISAYGRERYEKYNDKNGTSHGAPTPNPWAVISKNQEFFHRAHHDAESIYWGMVSAVLRVHPKDVEKESVWLEITTDLWTWFLTHKIPKPGIKYVDPRSSILGLDSESWEELFLGDMKDLGILMWKISVQVHPEYAYLGDDIPPDHLHEAVQRLILQYLVDHKTDVPLRHDYLRPIPTLKIQENARLSKHTSTNATGSQGTKGSSQTLAKADTGAATKRTSKSKTRDATQSAERAGSSTSRARGCSQPRGPVASPGVRTSARLREKLEKLGAVQTVQSIEEDPLEA